VQDSVSVLRGLVYSTALVSGVKHTP